MLKIDRANAPTFRSKPKPRGGTCTPGLARPRPLRTDQPWVCSTCVTLWRDTSWLPMDSTSLAMTTSCVSVSA